MIIRTPADLGAAIRARRVALGLDQAGLASRVGVARQWVVKIESGKSTAEVGLVLRTLNALGLQLEASEPFHLQVRETPDETAVGTPPAGISYDIDAALQRTRPNGAPDSASHSAVAASTKRPRKKSVLVRRRSRKGQGT